jgi:hypothetical protein
MRATITRLVESMNTVLNEGSSSLRFENTIWTYILGLKPSIGTYGLSFGGGVVILAICLFINASIRNNYRSSLVLLRVLLAFPAVVLFIDALFAPHAGQNRHFSSGAAAQGLYGLLKTWEICFSSFLDGEITSLWVRREPPKAHKYTNGSHKHANGSGSKEKMGEKKDIILPITRKDRIKYAADLALTLRGVSWYGDRRFDFLSSVVIADQNKNPSRRTFIVSRFIHFLLVCLAYDIFDSINKSQTWMRAEELATILDKETISHPCSYPPFAHQVTAYPLPMQAIFVLSVGVTTQLSLEFFYTPYAMICVGLFGVDPAAFPHFFNHPFSLATDSVKSFWAYRWHHIFRRVFDKAINPWMTFFRIGVHTLSGKLIRVTAIFTLCALLHCIIQARVLVHLIPSSISAPLFDADTFWFFASQPLAIIAERLFIFPLLNVLPGPVAQVLRRVWTWGWLFWSGRWWADVWVKMGMWQPEEQVVFLSIVRGLWKGEWIVNSSI